jgi:hypothetical protein
MKLRSIAVKLENRSCEVWGGQSGRMPPSVYYAPAVCIESGIHLRKAVRCLLHSVCRSERPFFIAHECVTARNACRQTLSHSVLTKHTHFTFQLMGTPGGRRQAIQYPVPRPSRAVRKSECQCVAEREGTQTGTVTCSTTVSCAWLSHHKQGLWVKKPEWAKLGCILKQFCLRRFLPLCVPGCSRVPHLCMHNLQHPVCLSRHALLSRKLITIAAKYKHRSCLF